MKCFIFSTESIQGSCSSNYYSEKSILQFFLQKWPSSLSYHDDKFEEETLKQDREIKDVVEGLHQLSLPCRDDKFKIRSSRQCEAERVIDGIQSFWCKTKSRLT